MSTSTTISTLSGDGEFSAYVARPASQPKAAIVVIQEIFGVNAGIRRKCDILAEQGYLAVAPDLFWRLERGIELDPDIEPEFRRALDLMGQFDQDEGIRDIEATIRWARADSGGRKVGAVGYCLGGRLAYMTAARTDVDATVGYYAVGIPDLLREANAIAHPLMLHIPNNEASSMQRRNRRCTTGSTITRRSRCMITTASTTGSPRSSASAATRTGRDLPTAGPTRSLPNISPR